MGEKQTVRISLLGTFSVSRGSLCVGEPMAGRESQSWKLLKYMCANYSRTVDVEELTRELIERGQERGEVWNINFPGCPLDELKGIKRDCAIADVDLYENDYSEEPLEDGKRNILVSAHIISPESAPEGSDARAVLENYISVGKIKCMVL